VDVKTEGDVLGDDSQPEIEKIRLITFAPESRSYQIVMEKPGKTFSIGREI